MTDFETHDEDIGDNSSTCCWITWRHQYVDHTGFLFVDLSDWNTCPRTKDSQIYDKYKDAADGRICAAHHLIAGPYIDKDVLCKCDLRVLIAQGCQCGGK